MREEVFDESNKKIEEKGQVIFNQDRENMSMTLTNTNFYKHRERQRSAMKFNETRNLNNHSYDSILDSSLEQDSIHMLSSSYISPTLIAKQNNNRSLSAGVLRPLRKGTEGPPKSSEVFNTDALLIRKEYLIEKIGQTYILADEADLDKDMLDNMFFTIRDQRTYDNAKVNEIRPYFEFQNKIHLILDRIKQTNEMRTKLQDVKIKQCKVQVKDNKKEMNHTLKDRVEEFLEEEQENKAQKLKMMGNQINRGAVVQNSNHDHKNSRSESALKKSSAMNVVTVQSNLKYGGQVAVNKENFRDLKLLSDLIDLAHLFEKYLVIKSRREKKENLEHDIGYQNELDQLKERIKFKSIIIERQKKENMQLSQIKLQTFYNNSIINRRTFVSKNSTQIQFPKQPQLTKNPSQNSRNQVLSIHSSSGNKKSMSSTLLITNEQEQQIQMETLHMRLLDQTSSEIFKIEDEILIEMYDKSQTFQNMLLKDHEELNLIKLDKLKQLELLESELKVSKTLSKKSFINIEEFEEKIDDSFIFQKNDSEEVKIQDLWELYQKQSDYLLFRREVNRVKSHLARLKWCLNEQTNVYAYKLSLI
eukprot:403368036